jgi:hypothetical protein
LVRRVLSNRQYDALQNDIDMALINHAVFVENGSHGGSTATPIARNMFDAYLLPAQAP